jgi:uncharacterized protein (DUF2384 family)
MSILTPLGMSGAEAAYNLALGRLFVDTFGMQHPQRSCKSAKSYAAHLTGLCIGVEFNGAQSVYAAVQKWLSRSADAIGFARPADVVIRGTLTVRHVHDAQTQAEQGARVHEWAREVWDAYSSQHELARGWICKAMADARRRKAR